ncbi:hypothetical protein [Streptomyces sp. NPDC052036]|uniref:hypothetical protein n=1 Tax=Streptomyces sp. NPDC052036 TaxID=3155171 RepID=UPI00344485C8
MRTQRQSGPAFGTTPGAVHTDSEEAEVQRRNHRELMTALSETNLRVNKDQLLSTGIRPSRTGWCAPTPASRPTPSARRAVRARSAAWCSGRPR